LVDFAIYPAGYCLRHGLELFMKQMSVYVAYERRDPALLYKLGHRLEEPWSAFKELARNAHRGLWDPGVEMEHHFDVIDSVIEDLSELDERGVLFRYPEDVKEKKNKPRSRTGQSLSMDLVHFGDWSATADAVFEAAQMILWTAGEATGILANHRGDEFVNLHDFVIAMEQSSRG
jgi:hypothetical protein